MTKNLGVNYIFFFEKNKIAIHPDLFTRKILIRLQDIPFSTNASFYGANVNAAGKTLPAT